MLRITSKNKVYFIGKAHEIVEAFDELCNKYELDTPLIQIIDDYLKS
ncbi:hypothetical protein [Brassicibacter mesophilus]